MLTVHHLQVSQSERIVWLCEELDIPYTLKLYQRSPIFSPPELKALHPMGAAPVITDGPITLAESAACCEYIIRIHGNNRLILPPTHPNYADYLYWFHFSNGNLQPSISRTFLLHRCAEAKDGLPANHPIQKQYAERLDILLKFMDERLGKVPWLAGEEFTAADIMSVFSLTTMRTFAPIELGAYPNILKWLGRVGEREAYRRAMEKGDKGMVPALGAAAPEQFLAKL